MSFKTKKVGEHLRIKAEPEGYSLIVIDSEPMDWISITFDLPPVNNKEVMVTGRDLKHYHSQIRDLAFDPSKVYLEIGAGLGEFIPRVVEQNPVHRPIVIDPVNYVLLSEMLQCAQSFFLGEKAQQRLQIYQERCRTVLNQEKVHLISNTLEDAIVNYPKLKKSVDVAVDHYAAAYHSSNPEATTALELGLLNHQGKLYSFLPQR